MEYEMAERPDAEEEFPIPSEHDELEVPLEDDDEEDDEDTIEELLEDEEELDEEVTKELGDVEKEPVLEGDED